MLVQHLHLCKSIFPGLEWDLYKNLYGQHLAQDTVSEEVANFLQKESPDRPLVLSFHGGSGTGKTLVSAMLGRHLYGTAMGSPYIHQFVPTLHFPSPDRVQQYRVAHLFQLGPQSIMYCLVLTHTHLCNTYCLRHYYSTMISLMCTCQVTA